jgi:gas vesicle protein
MPERTDDFRPADEIDLARRNDERSGEDDPAEIRAEIRETRERMSDNLEQLGERLNPGNIKDRVKQDIRDATIGKVENMAHSAADQLDEARETIGEAQRTIVDVVRDNPLPAAMVGIGLGWLAYNVRQRSSRDNSPYERGRSGRSARGWYGGGNYGREYGAGYAGRAGYAGEGAEWEGTKDRVSGQGSELSDKAQQTASEWADRAQGVAEDVADHTRYQARRIEDQFYENPLAIGAAALTLGLSAGLAIPETRKEDELMGGARDRLADKTREMVEDTKNKVENVVDRVADQAQDTARTAAREEGLTT